MDDKENPAMMIGKSAHETIERMYQDIMEWGLKSKDVYKQHAHISMSHIMDEARKRAIERLGIEGAYDALSTEQFEEIELEAIKWTKTVNETDAFDMLFTAVSNYYDNISDTETICTEIVETVQFTDFDGNIMPLPLKGIIDRIQKDKDGNEWLVDYKIV